MSERVLVVDGRTLTCEDVLLIASHPEVGVAVDPDAVRRAEAAWRLVPELVARREVYGRTTGVGANREEHVGGEAAVEHGRRLMRSHAGGTGEQMPAELVRAML